MQKGDGPKTGWTRELTNDGELILVITLYRAGYDDGALSVFISIFALAGATHPDNERSVPA